MRFAAALAVAALAAACSSSSPSTGTQQARLRNEAPAACTAAQIAACPSPDMVACPGGQEPVLDYSSDCCVHFSCQPVCSAAKACSPTPAPACPSGTTLWIGTAVEDCCPAYRCKPDDSTCDPATAVCTLAMPYCGPGIQPIVVGRTADCCPIYQCPCDPVTDAAGHTTAAPAALCGCTFPNCGPNEEMVCAGKDHCGGPCSCQPAHGVCSKSSECPSGEYCDLAVCRLPPVTGATAALCDDASKCGPAPMMPNTICADGTKAGPTDRCLADSSGRCHWEILECPPTPSCYGVCVPNVQSGCKADTDCPSGQKCEMSCTGWGCATSSAGTTACVCPATDPTCKCDAATGSCGGQTCTGQCVPATPTCDPSTPVACPMLQIMCPNNAAPIDMGVDPLTCCPIRKCPPCPMAATGAPAIACMMPSIDPTTCPCIKNSGTSPTSCCPTYTCGTLDSAGKCL